MGPKLKIRMTFNVIRALSGITPVPQPATHQTVVNHNAPPSDPVAGNRLVDPNTVALSDTVLQTNTVVVKILDQATVKRMRRRYSEKHETWPSEYEDITKEQLACLWAMVTQVCSPYADVALFVAFWARMIKRERFAGTIVDQYGEIITVELLGPPHYEAWGGSYTCFGTGATMIDIISVGKLTRYQKRIRGWAKQYPGC